MRPFGYAAPATVEQAVGLLAAEGSEALAGGTDLLSLLKDDVERVDRLVALRGVAGLSGIELDGGTLRIGAMTTLQELRDHDGAIAALPALAVAIDGVASPQLREMGTVGGDLLQRPRCWYYRRGFGLLALTADGRSMVTEGDNRYHAIFPTGQARFVNPSSLAPLLVALGAEAVVHGPGGERRLPVEALYQAPQAAEERENTLAPGELLAGVEANVAGSRSAVYEVRQRRSLDWPLMAAAVTLTGSGSRAERARIVLGHAAPTPHVAAAAGDVLSGQELTPETVAAAADAAVEGARPMSGNRYKIQLARTAVRRALGHAAGMEI
ncbi:MAG: molybdopterin dehydrogenase [Holophagales bacterium]|nr:molybdopterin dehydrogenase [Holophagales bacterium]MYH24345.1 molybdopterin dehydrogenase [Holophagales bacterium]